MKLTIDTFHGGLAQDDRDFTTTEAITGGNFDVSKTALTPYRQTVRDTSADGLNISSFDIDETTGKIIGIGYDTAISSSVTLYIKDSLSSNWSKQEVSTANWKSSTVTMYRGKPVAVGTDGSGACRLVSWDTYASPVAKGTMTGISYTPSVVPKPFVHPGDNILYVAFGNVVYKYNGTTFVLGTTLGENYEITSLNKYGNFLAIGARNRQSLSKSVVVIWNKETTTTQYEDVVDFGDGDLMVLANLDNYLFGISHKGYNPLSTNIKNELSIKAYSGGAATLIKTIEVPSGIGLLSNHYQEKDNAVYFNFPANQDALYKFGKNIDGRFVVEKDRFFKNGLEVNTIYGWGLVGDYLFSDVADSTTSLTESLWRTNEQSGYYEGDSYRTFLKNQSVPHEHRQMRKKLTNVSVAWTSQGLGDTTVYVDYSIDGGAFSNVLTDTKIDGEYVTEATRPTGLSAFETGREIQFRVRSSNGAIIKALHFEYDLPDSTLKNR